MPITPINSRIRVNLFLPIIFIYAFFALAGEAEAAANIVYVDTDCSNNLSTYNPTIGACTGGTSKVYSS